MAGGLSTMQKWSSAADGACDEPNDAVGKSGRAKDCRAAPESSHPGWRSIGRGSRYAVWIGAICGIAELGAFGWDNVACRSPRSQR
jgi:hypothetical protein